MLPRLQKLRKEFNDKRDIAYRYFYMLSIFNNLKLTEREIDLLTHIAVKGNIGSMSSKKEFMNLYETTINTLNNTICKLNKKKLIVKVSGKYRINPAIQIDFQEDREVYIFEFTCLFQNELKIK